MPLKRTLKFQKSVNFHFVNLMQVNLNFKPSLNPFVTFVVLYLLYRKYFILSVGKSGNLCFVKIQLHFNGSHHMIIEYFFFFHSMQLISLGLNNLTQYIFILIDCSYIISGRSHTLSFISHQHHFIFQFMLLMTNKAVGYCQFRKVIIKFM